MEMIQAQHLINKTIVPSRIRPGLVLLLDAYNYAIELSQDIWDFAVEIQSLQSAGLTTSDFRWLICKGYVSHAREMTRKGSVAREFEESRNLLFSKRSCFILTPAGHHMVEELSRGLNGSAALIPWRNGDAASGTNGHAPRFGDNQSVLALNKPLWRAVRPTWDAERHELRVGEQLVKVFRLPSPNQETILMAFEEEGWPPRIDDPLPLAPEIDPKRRLHDTLKSLNRNQKNRLIRFMGDGTGEGVRWELIR